MRKQENGISPLNTIQTLRDNSLLKSYEVIDNFLIESEFLPIKNMLLSAGFPWYHQDKVSGAGDEEGMLDTYFSHVLFSSIRQDSEEGYPRGITSSFYNLFLPFIHKLEVNSLIKLRVNNYPHTHKKIQNNFHVDNFYPHKVAILYINTNNGMTTLEDGTKINSVENRALLFDGLTKHCSTTCTNSRSRLVVNVNYI